MPLEEAAFNPSTGSKRLPRDRYWELRTRIEREQEQLRRRRLADREAGPLEVAARHTWTNESWQKQPLEWRRVIIELVTERVEVCRPTVVARCGRAGGQFDPERVKVKFAA
jgi:hypothetical protein